MRLATGFALALITAVLVADPGPLVAQVLDLPPNIYTFQKYDENLATLTVSQIVIHHAMVTITRRNAAGAEETDEVLVPEYRESSNTHLLAETTMRTMGGKDLDRKEAAKAIKKGQPVILIVKGQKLSDRFKNLFRDDVIVFEVKALGTQPELDPVEEPKKK